MDGPHVRLYPIVRFSPVLDTIELDIQSTETAARVRALLLDHAAQPSNMHNEFSCLGFYGAQYDLTDPKEFAFDRLKEFWNALALPNYVLLRGIYTLMKSDMLGC